MSFSGSGFFVLFILCWFLIDDLFGQATFETHESYTVGPGIQTIQTGDFNNDGWMDMVTANSSSVGSKRVSVLLNNKFGGFNLTNLTSVSSLTDISTADFDNNGNLDFVVISQSGDNLSVFLGNGNGTFNVTDIDAGDGPSDIHTADFNEDTNPDIAILHRFSDDIYIYYGDGMGNFGLPQIFSVESTAEYFTVADLNQNNNLDILTGGDNAVEFYAGDGMGNFATAVPTTGFFDFKFMTTAFLDSDGDLDLLGTVGNSSFRATGNGDGTFSAPIFFPQGKSISVVADFDADGNNDVAIAFNGKIVYYPGDGTGDFNEWRRINLDKGAFALAAADWDNDGILDLAGSGTISSSFGVIEVVRGKGDGYFSAPFDYPTPNDPRDLTMGDFNGDGREDLALCAPGGTDNLRIYAGQANGSFEIIDLLDISGSPRRIEALHINDDIHLDLAVLDDSNDEVKLYTGDGSGAFTSAGSFAISADWNMSVGDVNNDQITDLILAGVVQEKIEVFKGNNDATFSLLATIDLAEDEGAWEAIVALINEDTNPDLAIVIDPASGPRQFQGYQGDGAGVFTPTGSAVALSSGGLSLTVDDFDGDGHKDFIAAGGASVADILIGDGTFTFTQSSINTTSNEVSAVVDFDGDGVKDLLISRDVPILSNAGTIDIYDGDGNGNFGTQWFFRRFRAGGYRVEIADFNNDGKNDIATLINNGTYDALSILLNTSIAPLCEEVQITNNPSSAALCEGEDHILFVSATGKTPLTYQWQKNGVDIIGENSASLIISNATSADAGQYHCIVSNICGDDTSANALITVNSVPTSPTTTGASGCSGESITLTASGSSDGNYRWYDVAIGGSPLSGEVNGSFATPALSISTDYYVSISDGTCESTLITVSATIIESVAFSSQPANQSVNIGDDVTFTITATGNNISYQWKKDDVDLSGETLPSLTLMNITIGDQGNYTCSLSNQCNTEVSNTALLTVLNPTTEAIILITNQPQNQTVCEGENISFTIEASGDAGLTYQWQEDAGSGFTDITDNTVYSGATTAILSISAANAAMSGYQYQCVVSGDNADNVTTSSAALTVVSAPTTTITLIDDVLIGPSGGDTYRWLKQNEPITGATDQNLQLVRPLRTGDFTVQVSIGNCMNVSGPLLVTGISGNANLENPNLYPIPFDHNLSVSNLPLQDVTIELWNLAGSRHFQMYIPANTNQSISINTESLSPGIYLFVLLQDENVYSQRVIKY